MIAGGWAVVQDGEINVRTVSPDRRGAIVNWLVAEAHRFVSAHDTDEEIEDRWERDRGTARVLQVAIIAERKQ